MSIFECLKDYERKHGKLIKKNSQSQDNPELQEFIIWKKLYSDYISDEEKSKEEFKND